LAENEEEGDGAAKKGEILKGGCEGIELGDSGGRAEDRGQVEEEAAKPGETLERPDRGMLRDVFIGGRHVWFNEEGIRAGLPEPVTEMATFLALVYDLLIFFGSN
jgi:hypothetical protein